MKNVMMIAVAAVVALIAFGTTAFAAGAVTPSDGTLLDLLKPVWSAVSHGQYAFAASLALVLAVAVARQYGGNLWPWLKTGAGAALLALMGAFGAALATGLAAGAAITWHMVWVALGVGVTAAGGYSLVKALLVDPVLVPLANKYPKLRPILLVILWVFDRHEETKPAARTRVVDHRNHA